MSCCLLFLLISFVIIDWKKNTLVSKKIISLCIVLIIVFLGYFTMQPHKEFRYILPIYPSLFILAYHRCSFVMETFNNFANPGCRSCYNIYYQQCSICSINEYCIHSGNTAVLSFLYCIDRTYWIKVVRITPTITAFSPVTLYEGYNSWRQMDEYYEANKAHTDYVAIDSCDYCVCEPGSGNAM